jgi:hypothetical protein
MKSFVATTILSLALAIATAFPGMTQPIRPTGELKATWETGASLKNIGGLQAPWDKDRKPDTKPLTIQCPNGRILASGNCPPAKR